VSALYGTRELHVYPRKKGIFLLLALRGRLGI